MKWSIDMEHLNKLKCMACWQTSCKCSWLQFSEEMFSEATDENQNILYCGHMNVQMAQS